MKYATAKIINSMVRTCAEQVGINIALTIVTSNQQSRFEFPETDESAPANAPLPSGLFPESETASKAKSRASFACATGLSTRQISTLTKDELDNLARRVFEAYIIPIMNPSRLLLTRMNREIGTNFARLLSVQGFPELAENPKFRLSVGGDLKPEQLRVGQFDCEIIEVEGESASEGILQGIEKTREIILELGPGGVPIVKGERVSGGVGVAASAGSLPESELQERAHHLAEKASDFANRLFTLGEPETADIEDYSDAVDRIFIEVLGVSEQISRDRFWAKLLSDQRSND